ncbi:anti-sigma-I factor RsgI family protein [Oceanobacillus salinisoli]|uniref:anti-sigma-I factor RsgI family protein n=1 Tax=Oceanobacillus salinisoli TaxID=2678611 RepID=UPI0012E128A1|nr:hypothetical protein [Oceanobacillus salinisoli]
MKKYTIEGIVTKVTESEYVLFCDDGTFRNIPLTKDDIPMMGERKTYTAKSRNLPLRIVSTVAMVAVLFIAFLAYGGIQNHSKTNYIAAIDINPSLEAHLDEDLNVIKLLPLNTDGKQIADSIESEGVDFYQVVDFIVSESVSKGYLSVNEKGRIETTIVKVTSDSNPPSERELKEVIQTQLQSKNIVADVQVFNETKEFYDQSERAGVSMNKYRHYQTLRDQGLVQDIKEVKEKSIKQLQDMIEEEDEKKVPVKTEQGKGDSGENAKPNPELRQNQSQSTLNPKGDQTEHKPALDDKQEPSDNEGGQQKGKKPSNKSSSPENEASSNQRSSDPPPTREENKANQKAETEDSQTNSNDNTQQKNETSIESQPETETNAEKKDESASKGETIPEEENLDSNHNKANKNRPSSSSKP